MDRGTEGRACRHAGRRTRGVGIGRPAQSRLPRRRPVRRAVADRVRVGWTAVTRWSTFAGWCIAAFLGWVPAGREPRESTREHRPRPLVLVDEVPRVAAAGRALRAQGWTGLPGIPRVGAAQPAPVVPRTEPEWFGGSPAELVEWFRGRWPVAWMVQPNPEVADGSWRVGTFIDGSPFDIRPDAARWSGAPCPWGGPPVVAEADGWDHPPRDPDAWSHLFGYGWTVPLRVPAEPAVPGLPHAGGVDAAATGAPAAVAPVDQPGGACPAPVEPAHGADAAAHPGAAEVAAPVGDVDPWRGNPFAGFLVEPCHCGDVDGCHTLGDCRWSHLRPDFHLTDPYGAAGVVDEDQP